jgi:hypothetical protein
MNGQQKARMEAIYADAEEGLLSKVQIEILEYVAHHKDEAELDGWLPATESFVLDRPD